MLELWEVRRKKHFLFLSAACWVAAFLQSSDLPCFLFGASTDERLGAKLQRKGMQCARDRLRSFCAASRPRQRLSGAALQARTVRRGTPNSGMRAAPPLGTTRAVLCHLGERWEDSVGGFAAAVSQRFGAFMLLLFGRRSARDKGATRSSTRTFAFPLSPFLRLCERMLPCGAL